MNAFDHRYYVTTGKTGVFYVLRVNFNETVYTRFGKYVANRDHLVKKLTTDKESSLAKVNQWIMETGNKVSVKGFDETPMNSFHRRTKEEMEQEKIDFANEYYNYHIGKVPFGKYDGMPFDDLLNYDIEYVNWMSKNFEPKTINGKNPYMNEVKNKLTSEFMDFLNWFKANVCMIEDKFKATDSQFIGSVNEKISVKTKLTKKVFFQRYYNTTNLLIFVDDQGNKITTFYSGSKYFEEGLIYDITGKVKEHKTYKGEKQTVLTRIK